MAKPSWSRPQSRRFRPVLRLFEHFALTWAFVEAADPQIVNGSSSRPSWSRSAMTGLSVREGGHGATKTSAVSCRAGSRAGWQLMILISYLLVQKEIMSCCCRNARGFTVPGQWPIGGTVRCLFQLKGGWTEQIHVRRTQPNKNKSPELYFWLGSVAPLPDVWPVTWCHKVPVMTGIHFSTAFPIF